MVETSLWIGVVVEKINQLDLGVSKGKILFRTKGLNEAVFRYPVEAIRQGQWIDS
jgi:hypothetical protein